jgi:hypothetical protein
MSDEDWTWELSSAAQDDIDALSPSEQERIVEKLDEIILTDKNPCGFLPASRTEVGTCPDRSSPDCRPVPHGPPGLLFVAFLLTNFCPSVYHLPVA